MNLASLILKLGEKDRYKIVRFCRDDNDLMHHAVIARGMTLDEAQAHCRDPRTQEVGKDGLTEWFDGYETEA